jgi:hypothetical protein
MVSTWMVIQLGCSRAKGTTPVAEAFIKLRTGANGKTRKVLIPTVQMLDAYVRRLPFGKASDIAAMKKEFALASGADLTCPVTVRLHLQALCEAALEACADGAGVAPFWRLIGSDDVTARKVRGAPELIREMRTREKV